MEKIKLLIVGDGVVPTGFSRVLHSIFGNFNLEEYDISWMAVNYFGDPHGYPYKIYPASLGNPGDLFGFNRLTEVINFEKPDIVFMLNDSPIIAKYLKIIKTSKIEKTFKLVVYYPVDSYWHDPDWYKDFDIVDEVVTYTEFGKEVTEPLMNKEVKIITHGVSTNIFYELDKKDLRTKVLGNKFGVDPNELFIVFNGNRNQPRKRIDLTMLAFAEFAKDKPNAKLYLHMGYVDANHINVDKLAIRLGIDDKIILTNNKIGPQSVTDQELNAIYNLCDVGVNTSFGEGFGLVNVEQAVTRCAQIVPDHSACKELFGDCGLLIKRSANWIMDGSMTVGGIIDPADLANKLDFLYKNRDVLEKVADKCYQKFTDEKYSWKTVAGDWDSLFKSLIK
ncbi:MAG: glycosyltransferase [Veillonellaceae bacterium]|nr:glycosyltransferase [Veillonellaceae bacterium]